MGHKKSNSTSFQKNRGGNSKRNGKKKKKRHTSYIPKPIHLWSPPKSSKKREDVEPRRRKYKQETKKNGKRGKHSAGRASPNACVLGKKNGKATPSLVPNNTNQPLEKESVGQQQRGGQPHTTALWAKGTPEGNGSKEEFRGTKPPDATEKEGDGLQRGENRGKIARMNDESPINKGMSKKGGQPWVNKARIRPPLCERKRRARQSDIRIHRPQDWEKMKKETGLGETDAKSEGGKEEKKDEYCNSHHHKQLVSAHLKVRRQGSSS